MERNLGIALSFFISRPPSYRSKYAGAAGFLTTLPWLDSAGVMVTGADTEPTLAVTAAQTALSDAMASRDILGRAKTGSGGNNRRY